MRLGGHNPNKEQTMKTLAVLIAVMALGVAISGSLGAMYVTAHTHDVADAYEIAFLD